MTFRRPTNDRVTRAAKYQNFSTIRAAGILFTSTRQRFRVFRRISVREGLIIHKDKGLPARTQENGTQASIIYIPRMQSESFISDANKFRKHSVSDNNGTARKFSRDPLYTLPAEIHIAPRNIAYHIKTNTSSIKMNHHRRIIRLLEVVLECLKRQRWLHGVSAHPIVSRSPRIPCLETTLIQYLPTTSLPTRPSYTWPDRKSVV